MRLWMLTGLLASGCAAHFPMPMTATDLARYRSGPALVAYLGQPDASPTVCDLRARSPHLPAVTDEVRASLFEGLVRGQVGPALWRRCVDALVKGLPRSEAPAVFDELARAYRKLLTDSDLEENPSLSERLAALHRFYLERPTGLDADPEVIAPLFEELRSALAKGKLGAVAARFGQELVATLDVERGEWQGHAVDAALMDALAASGNEMTLTRFAERLPSPSCGRRRAGASSACTSRSRLFRRCATTPPPSRRPWRARATIACRSTSTRS